MDKKSKEAKEYKYRTDIDWLDYKPGGQNKYGEQITEILGMSSKSIVYMIEDNGKERIKCHWDPDKCKNGSLANATAHELINQIESGIKKEEFKKIGRNLVGSALFKAFETEKTDNETDYFATAQEYVDTKMSERVHFRYLLAAFISVLSAIAIFVICYYLFPLNDFGIKIILCGGIGSIGAFVSVLQRYKKIEIQKYSTTSYLVLGAITRILLGIIFGMVFYLSQQSDLILPILDGNDYSIYLLAFVSGISERFVPEIIEKMEDIAVDKNKTNGN